MERTRINSISQIFNGKKLFRKNLSDLDLSGLDLSIIPMSEWEGCIFYNTNVSNTGIKFKPNLLGFGGNRYLTLVDCDFSDNDLTYLTSEDFCVGEFRKSQIVSTNCNYENTGINFLVNLFNCKLDKSYGDLDFDYWEKDWERFYTEIDLSTYLNNPFLNIPSHKLARMIGDYIREQNRKAYIPNVDYSNEHKRKLVSMSEDVLELDKQGYLRKLYRQLEDSLNLHGKFWFFMGHIRENMLENVYITGIPIELLGNFEIVQNVMKNVSIDNSLKDLMKIRPDYILDFYGEENTYRGVSFPGIKYSSWRERLAEQKRISTSLFTFFKKVYLELSRICNANCKFCRNSTFPRIKYDLENIVKTLESIKKHVNAVVIGGGEPTLRIDDVKELYNHFLGAGIDWHMFTNGTSDAVLSDYDIYSKFKINLSRHAISDEENARVFNAGKSDILTSEQVKRLVDLCGPENMSLNATCFKGGLDNGEKIIDYINYWRDLGVNKFLIQNQQKEASLYSDVSNGEDLSINLLAFNQVRNYLLDKKFKEKQHIIATGGYITTILKNKVGTTIALQDYISEDELSKYWQYAIKRVFDLSIDPAGNLYENWHQKTGQVENEFLKKD